ncbi:hypothetical protein NLI96_g2336 [Meripilus lineatus]|uniref:Copper transport protein n=1 Tax=Meripilus lineatus TaxID=2056292 RepID=A0AAD5VB52_9APHY|nr:hypothetical protein NLI96_g2336 [Physisporinus lineatus]
MARRYDSRTTIFSPEGRLYQIEYAMEAISHAGTVLGVLAKDGIVLAAEKKVTGKLLDLSGVKEGGYGGSGEKIFLLNSNVVGGVAGITADANSLVNYARSAAQRHLFLYNEDIPVELLAQRLCDLKQGYTQYGGLRPFGVSLLYAGYDPNYQFQLYHSDPSGNYSGWKATCIGANNGTASSLLKQEYKDDITMEDAIGLVLRVMSKTMDSTTLGSEKLEFATMTLDPTTKQPKAKIYRPAEVDALLQQQGLGKKEDDAEMNHKRDVKRKRHGRSGLIISLSPVLHSTFQPGPDNSLVNLTTMSHGDHDMMDMDMDVPRKICKMNMLWNTQIENTCIVFRSWHVANTTQFVFSCFAIVLLGVFYEWLRVAQKKLDVKIAATLSAQGKGKGTVSGRASPEIDSEEAGLLTGSRVRKDRPGTPLPPWPRTSRALLYGLQVFLSFFLMLVFMTYNAYLILATVVGAAIGHYVFSPDMDIEAVLAGASGGNKGMACH